MTKPTDLEPNSATTGPLGRVLERLSSTGTEPGRTGCSKSLIESAETPRAWLLAQPNPQAADAAIRRSLTSSHGVEVTLRTEHRFPPGGGFYALVTGADVRLSPDADLDAAHAKLSGALVPPTVEQAEDWIAMLQAACARRGDSEAAAAVAFTLYVGELCQWPADIARQVCMNRARGEGVSGTNWFPTLAEISQECARLTAPRRAMLEAIKGRAPKALAKYDSPPRREPTDDEIARVQRMKAEAMKQLEEASERGKPAKAPLPAIHGKTDATGVTPELRALIERQRGEA